MSIKVLGLDPGTVNMGYGILTFHGNQIKCIEASRIQCSARLDVGERLYRIGQQLSDIFQKHQPQHMAMERVFLGKNPDSAFKLGQAFGIGLYHSYKVSCSVYQYSSRTVKKFVTGNGGASKESVYSCVQNILKIKPDSIDTSDAVAVALCHIYHYRSNQMQQRTSQL